MARAAGYCRDMCSPCGNSEFMHVHPYPRCDTQPASPESAVAEGREAQTQTEEMFTLSPAAFCSCFSSMEACRESWPLLIPFGTLGIYLVMFWKVLRDWITFSCSCMTHSNSRFHWSHLSATIYLARSNPVYWAERRCRIFFVFLCLTLSLQNQGVLSSHLIYLIAQDKLIFIYKTRPFLLLPWKHLSGWCLNNYILKNLCNINN